MSDTNLRTIATYGSAPIAHLASAMLQSHGIRAAVAGDQIAEALGYLGVAISTVELLVHDEDSDAAGQLLSEWELKRSLPKQDHWGNEYRMGWLCGHCSEINQQTFDSCWSCSAARRQDAKLVPLPDDTNAIPDPPHAIAASENPDPSPFRIPTVEDLPAVNTKLATRTFRSAVLGLAFPLLAVYSFGLAWKCLAEGRPTPKIWAALFLSAAGVLLWIILFFATGLHKTILRF
ncbi:MAG: DUF2007 domain-containing protein [Fuerstiella sp.]|jgi:hypothetical protein|nr:DUF2007 domain-containing protein [Fuerstiella sp.]